MEIKEKIFLIPMDNNKYAQFKFHPYHQIKAFLDEYNIPYEMKDTQFHNKIFINSKQQKITLYTIPCYNNQKRKYHMFYFVSDIIDKILNYYKVDYERKEK